MALSSAGLVAISGGALWLSAFLKLKDVDDACRALPEGGCTRSDATRRFESAHIQQYARAGIALGVLGGAALLSGLTLELWHRRHGHVDLALASNGLLLRETF